MPLSPELKILDLVIEAANTARKLNPHVHNPHFQDFVCELATIRASLSKDVGVIEAHHPQETGGEEYWKVFNKFRGCECGHEHPYKPETVAKIVSLAEAKGAEKERALWHDTIRHICQTVHQAYNHEGEPADCRHGVCINLSLLTPPEKE